MPDQVFLDANILHSSQVSTVLRPRAPERFKWGDREHEVIVSDFVDYRLRDALEGEVRAEADLIPRIAQLAKDGAIELISGDEVNMEKWGLPMSGGRRTVMDGAEILWTEPPMKYSRVVAGPEGSPRDYRTKFIHSVSDPRFLQIAKACGAFDSEPPKTNTLWDAFHVWWAEAAGARYFLTLDFRLINRSKNEGQDRPSLRLVRPSEMIRAVEPGA